MRPSTADSRQTTVSAGSEHRAVTARAVAIGVALTAFLAWLTPVSLYRLFSARLHMAALPPGVVAAFCLVLAANYWVKRTWPRRCLSAGELVVIVSMMWVGMVALWDVDVTGNMLAIMAAPEYFASTENRWDEYYLAYIPSWTIPSDRTGAVRYFYNGLPQGLPVPWGVWRLPFFWWGSLVVAALVVIICLITVVQEQWHDREKLTFPMADIPLALVGQEGETPWVRTRLFWIGAAVPSSIIVWNMLSWFYPLVPYISFTQVETGMSFFGIPHFYTKVDFFTIGLAYFAPLQVIRGFWIGRMLIGLEMSAAWKFGFAEGMNKGFEPWSDWGSPNIAWQCFGSLMMFVLWGLWYGREHFRRVLKSAFVRPPGLSEQMRQRYRAAVWTLAGGLCYIAFWLRTVGMTWPIILLFLPVLLFVTIGVSKLAVESSLYFVESPVSAQTVVMQTFGTQHISQVAMTAMVLSYVAYRANAGHLMPQVAFASRMGDRHEVPRGRLYVALVVAGIVSIVVAAAVTVSLAYEVGAFNFQSLPFKQSFMEVYESLARKSDESFGTDYYRLGFFGVGFVLMAVVLAIRVRLTNFWLHPIGLTYSTTSVAGLQTINVFLAWASKAMLDRLGGHRLVNRAKPFFLGLICGHSVGVALGICVDAVWFPGRGHYVLTGW